MTKNESINATLVTLAFLFGTLFLLTLFGAVNAIRDAAVYRSIADNALVQVANFEERSIANNTPRTVIVDAVTGDYVTCQPSYILQKGDKKTK